MVGRMVDEMAKHLPVCMNVFTTAGRLYEPGLLEASFGHAGHERPPLHLDRFPTPADVGQRFQIGCLWNGGGGVVEATGGPELLPPHHLSKRAVDSAVNTLPIP